MGGERLHFNRVGGGDKELLLAKDELHLWYRTQGQGPPWHLSRLGVVWGGGGGSILVYFIPHRGKQ